MCELSSYFSDSQRLQFQEKVYDMKGLLDRRKDDLFFLKREKRYVESLLTQLGRVKHFVQGGPQEWH